MMHDNAWLQKQTRLTLERLLPRIQPQIDELDDRDVFLRRLDKHFPDLFRLLVDVYSDRYDLFFHLEQILETAVAMYAARSADLKQLDLKREADPLWFQSEQMVGGVCYVDLFAGNLEKLRDKIPYFEELGLTYLHLMPPFKVSEKNNDGGYAVSDYRTIRKDLGTMEEFADLAAEFRQHGISLVLDFVFNHTSDEHDWAVRARQGEEPYVDYYYLFDDRTIPDMYEPYLREIFPEQDPGSYTYLDDVNKWVWTTFRRFQWDLNYSNPGVFRAMMEEMLFLANQGVEIMRLDAVAFIWKQMGTSCENLPQAHKLIQAFNAVTRIVAPALLFKSEAIVHPSDVAKYISWEECPISYNPTLMALLWESLATRNVKLLRHSMSQYFYLPDEASWVNYVRVHDDIGWTFSDESAWELGINAFDHRMFLNAFYTGEFHGSFAHGVSFNFNPVTMDRRISGTAASLIGIEQAIEMDDEQYLKHAIRRLLLIHSVIMSAGGIPLIYLGDEIAMLNDYTYEKDPNKRDDSRWVHRPKFDWDRAEKRHDSDTVPGRVFQGIQKLIQIRKQTPDFADDQTLFFDTMNPHVLGFTRNQKLLVLGNFSEFSQIVSMQVLSAYITAGDAVTDLWSGEQAKLDSEITLEPYQFLWLQYA